MPKSTPPQTETDPRGTSTVDAPSPPIPFEQALEQLESIVQRMEDGTLSLDDSLAAYRRGAELVKACETALEHVKEQVRVLDGTLLRPLSEVSTRTGGPSTGFDPA